MTIMKRKRGGALDDLPIREKDVPIAPKPKQKADKIKASFFLTANDHARLADFCLKNGYSQQKVFEYALNLWLITNGEPGLESVDRREKEEGQ